MLLLIIPTLVQPTRPCGQRPRQNDNRDWPMSCRERNDGRRTQMCPTRAVERPWKLGNGRRLSKRSKRQYLNITFVVSLSPDFSPTNFCCRGKIGQNHYYRCTRRIRKHRNQSRRRTNLYGTIRGTWPFLDACWMRSRGKKSLRNPLGCRIDLDPVSLPECTSFIRAKCKFHFTRDVPLCVPLDRLGSKPIQVLHCARVHHLSIHTVLWLYCPC